jgi:hypothetical protein
MSSSDQILNKLLALEHARMQIGVPEPTIEALLERERIRTGLDLRRKEESPCSLTQDQN